MSGNQQPRDIKNGFRFIATFESIEKNIPICRIHFPDNFREFPFEEQKTLFQLMLSQFEDSPILSESISTTSLDESISLEGLEVELNLNYGETGFLLEVNGPDYILNGESKICMAQSIHAALIGIESSELPSVTLP